MAPWGVLEARAAGLETVIRGARAVDARYNVPYDELVAPSAAEAAKGDASTILPGVRGPRALPILTRARPLPMRLSA